MGHDDKWVSPPPQTEEDILHEKKREIEIKEMFTEEYRIIQSK